MFQQLRLPYHALYLHSMRIPVIYIFYIFDVVFWIDPHLTFYLLVTTPSLLDMASLYDMTLFDILHDLIETESFTAGYLSWRKPVGRPGNWVFSTWDTISQLNSLHMSFVTYEDDNNQQGCAYFLLVTHTCQIAKPLVSITRRTPQGGGVSLWVEVTYNSR